VKPAVFLIALAAGAEICPTPPASAPAEAHEAAALCETRAGRPARATAGFKRLVELRPADWQAWNNLGANRIALRQPQPALAAFRRATDLNPRSAEAWFNLGSTLLALGSAAEAFPALDRAYGLAPADPDTRAARLEAAHRTGAEAERLLGRRRYAPARALLRSVEPALAGSAGWNNALGYSEFKLGRPEAALALLQKALELEPKNETYLLDLGELLIHYRANTAAREIFEIAARSFPASPRLQFMLAVSYVLEERRPEAIALLERVIQMDPDFEPAYKALGECYEEAKNGRALVALGAKFGRGVTGPYLRGLGLLQLAIEERGAIEPAIAALRLAARQDPASPEVRFRLARAYQYAENDDAAIEELKAVVELDPEHDRAHYQLAMLYRRLGRQQLAGAAMKRHSSLKQRPRPLVMLVERDQRVPR